MDRKTIQKAAGTAGNVATTITVPQGERWELLNISITLTTDATVTNRVVQIEVRDAAASTKFVNFGDTLAASDNSIYVFAQMISGADVHINALGKQILDAGEDVHLIISNGQAGDSYDYLLEYLKVEI